MSFFTWFDIGMALVIFCLFVLAAWLGYQFAKRRYLNVLFHIQSMAANSYHVWNRLEIEGSCPAGVTDDFALIEATCEEAICGIFEEEVIDES